MQTLLNARVYPQVKLGGAEGFLTERMQASGNDDR